MAIDKPDKAVFSIGGSLNVRFHVTKSTGSGKRDNRLTKIADLGNTYQISPEKRNLYPGKAVFAGFYFSPAKIPIKYLHVSVCAG